MPILRLLTLVLVALAAAPALADAAIAPGRITFAVDPSAPERTVDARGASSAVALPDGRVVLAGGRPGAVAVAQLTAGGRLDASFADGGLARVELPGVGFRLADLLRRPDGRLLLVGTGEARDRFESEQLVVVGLRPDGALDPAFGEGGIARPGVQTGCGSCDPAALAPDGSLVLTGATGQSLPPAPGQNQSNTRTWVVTRLTPSGAADPGFGVRTVPGTGPGDAAGYGAAVAPDGRMTLLGTQGRRPIVARLLADGAADPAFNGGAPQTAPVVGLDLSVSPAGAATVLGFEGIGRLTPDGRPNAAFGGDGSVALQGPGLARLVAGRDGDALVFRPESFDPRPASRPTLLVDRVDAGGSVTRTAVRLGFGGGFASFPSARLRVLPVPSLAQNAFQVGDLVERPDGSFLLAGGVKVVQASGEGTGRSTAPFAAAALTPELAPDLAFGGPRTRQRASLRLVAQRARISYGKRGVAVRLTASEPGLMLVRVRDRSGRLLAESVQPVYRPGSRTVRVQLGRRGRELLRRGRRTSVRVTARFRDVLAGEVTPRSVRGALR